MRVSPQPPRRPRPLTKGGQLAPTATAPTAAKPSAVAVPPARAAPKPAATAKAPAAAPAATATATAIAGGGPADGDRDGALLRRREPLMSRRASCDSAQVAASIQPAAR